MASMFFRPLLLRLVLAAAVLACVLMMGAAWAVEQAPPSPALVTVMPGVTLDVSSVSLPTAVLAGLLWLGWQVRVLTGAFERKDLRGLIQVDLGGVVQDANTTTSADWDGRDRRATNGVGRWPRLPSEADR